MAYHTVELAPWGEVVGPHDTHAGGLRTGARQVVGRHPELGRIHAWKKNRLSSDYFVDHYLSQTATLVHRSKVCLATKVKKL
jgi:hypothetical protein